MFINIILPIILLVGLIGTFIYLRLKNKGKNVGVTLVMAENDIIDYSPISSSLSLSEMLLFDEINYHRKNINIGEVKPERECRVWATKHTKYMISEGKVSHDEAYLRRYELFRRNFTSYGENVAYGFSNSKSMFKAYLNSECHRKVIEDPKFNYVGIRTLKDDKGRNYNTLIFSTYE